MGIKRKAPVLVCVKAFKITCQVSRFSYFATFIQKLWVFICVFSQYLWVYPGNCSTVVSTNTHHSFFLLAYNLGHHLGHCAENSWIQDRSLYHNATDLPPSLNLLGTVFSLCCVLLTLSYSITDTARDVRGVERMTGLIGQTTVRVYWSLSRLIHSKEWYKGSDDRVKQWWRDRKI